ncbi:metal ABC transporter substrate-binding protein [Corynebacterium cystitidis]|uniref:Zinc transport system substrate-binding protein n=1 Tax=Corynebacterium cystitidis DSM 20524 TaxID=1121357 RepID=A0A1H9RZH5_9CORY|nr:zinc ABC transporter substrate-binding protein [Corynebacterium cystitidis]WJY82138.1 High-affinity zinc uptake system binding-protein ZnuA precursor [Corynebacterium cystitidis DSM 20524]SER77775.1 zinc transport system substrate-binding protein [Corynebacterium cystitidis DSM 20524]SNV78740.1 Manganese ABC transporter substrate-binding protein [Corynebacterium cystitidis]
MLTRRNFLALCAVGGAALLTGCSPRRQAPAPDPNAPLVYASFYPIRSLVETIAGDGVQVRSFMEDGQDPHMWEPSPQAIRSLADADLLVVNGANMEAWLPQVQANFPDLPILQLSDYVELITYKGAAALGEFQFLAAVDLKPGEQYRIVFGHTHERNMRAAFFTASEGTSTDDLVQKGRDVMGAQGVPVAQRETFDLVDGEVFDIDMGHESGTVSFTVPEGSAQWYFAADRVSQEILSYRIVDSNDQEIPLDPVIEGSSTGTDFVTFDPHSWLSVINAKRYCNAIESTLREHFPDQERTFQKNRSGLVRELTRLQNEYKEKFKDASRRDFVVSHNAFGYLARDFALEQMSLQGLTTNQSPSLYSLVNTVRHVRNSGLEVVYYEFGNEDPGITTIVDEAGVEALPLASMEIVDPNDGLYDEGYVGYLEMNLRNLNQSIYSPDQEGSTPA